MSYPRHQYPSKREVEFETKNIGNIYTTNSQPVYFEKHYRENFDASNYTDYVGNGCIYYGAAGCGKTTKLLKLASKATDPIILSFTNKAIENIKSRISEELQDKCHTFDSYFGDYHGRDISRFGGQTNNTTKLLKLASKATDPIILSFTNKAIENIKSRISEELQDKCHTFDSYFGDYHGRDISSLEGKPIFIEVYSMTPSKWMTKIYQAFTKYDNTVYTFGEINQCDQKLIRG